MTELIDKKPKHWFSIGGEPMPGTPKKPQMRAIPTGEIHEKDEDGNYTGKITYDKESRAAYLQFLEDEKFYREYEKWYKWKIERLEEKIRELKEIIAND